MQLHNLQLHCHHNFYISSVHLVACWFHMRDLQYNFTHWFFIYMHGHINPIGTIRNPLFYSLVLPTQLCYNISLSGNIF